MTSCNSCGARIRNGTRFCEECGAPLFAVTSPHLSEWEEAGHATAPVLPVGCGTQPPKKVGTAVLLSALFGPLGLLYSSVPGALYMLLFWCFLVLATCDDWISDQMIATLIAWPICVVWAAIAARSFNQDRR